MEYVFCIILSYVFLLANGLVMVMQSILDEEEGTDNRRKRMILFFASLIATTVMYFFQVRIGTISFINGLIFAWLVFQIKSVVLRWNPFIEAKEEALKAVAK